MHGRACKDGTKCNFGTRVAKSTLLMGSVVPAWGVLEQTLLRHEARLPKLDRTLRVVSRDKSLRGWGGGGEA